MGMNTGTRSLRLEGNSCHKVKPIQTVGSNRHGASDDDEEPLRTSDLYFVQVACM